MSMKIPRSPSAYAPVNYSPPTMASGPVMVEDGYTRYGSPHSARPASARARPLQLTTSVPTMPAWAARGPKLDASMRYLGPQKVVEEPTVTYVSSGWEPRLAVLEATIDQLRTQFQQEQQARLRADERFQEEQQARLRTDQKVVSLEAQLEALKAHLGELDFFQTNTLEKALRSIEDRGNIQVNFQTGHVLLLRPITFVPRTTREAPTAEFSRLDVANAVCKDLAEVMNLFNCPVEVEGHTKGGESEFWQALADDRARVVVEMIVKNGADPTKIASKGLPGKRGSNETKTVVHLNLPRELLK